MTERKQVRITDGLHLAASGLQETKLHYFASSYPFTQQLDVVVPFSSELRDIYASLSTRYYSKRTTLSNFIRFATSSVEKYSTSSNLLAVGKPSYDTDDAWCLDSRGVLTLTVGKDTYEEIGLVGQPLPWKECQDKHVIRIFLSESTPQTNEAKVQNWQPLGTKQRDRLNSWDQRRGLWDIIMTFDSDNTPLNEELVQQDVSSSIRQIRDTKIPQLNLERASQQLDDDARSEWDEEVQAYFEWVGMACLGSQRLQNEDNVDPYLAVYDPPLSFRVGDLLYVRWTGLLHPTFINRVLDLALKAPYAALVGHSVTTSPVTFISPPPLFQSRPRAPREDSEDTRALLLTCVNESIDSSEVRWVLAESIGQWDARWG